MQNHNSFYSARVSIIKTVSQQQHIHIIDLRYNSYIQFMKYRGQHNSWSLEHEILVLY